MASVMSSSVDADQVREVLNRVSVPGATRTTVMPGAWSAVVPAVDRLPLPQRWAAQLLLRSAEGFGRVFGLQPESVRAVLALGASVMQQRK